MEVHVGLGRVYARPPGKTFRGAFQSLFQSVREAFQGPGGAREEPGAQPPSALPAASAREQQQPGSSPTYLPLDEQPAGSKGLQPPDERPPLPPSAGPALLAPSFQSCPGGGDLKELLGESGPLQLLPPPGPEGEGRGGEGQPAKEDFLGESAKELCKAVSASMGLAVEALEASGGGGDPLPARGDCMFALPGAHPRPLPLATCKIVEAEEGEEGGGGRAGGGPAGEGGALAMDVPGPLSLYKGSPELDEPAAAAFPGRDYYNFQLALAPHGRIKLESPLEYAAAAAAAGSGGVWGAQCRRPAEVPALAPHYGGPPWHPFFAEEGQLYGPEGAGPGPFAYGRSPGPAVQEGADLPAEVWYPGGVVGRMPFAPAAGCIKTELSPWLEGYPGAYGDGR